MPIFKNKFPYYFLIVLPYFLMGCGNRDSLFDLIPAAHSGIDFNNLLTESNSLNILRFEYIYNGAGVGVGDFNNDGLKDVFFAGNMVSSRLYLNKGDFKFQDITHAAKVNTTLWCTGVSIIDINQDGLLDIYVCTINPKKDQGSPNLLFLNKGVNKEGSPVFEEIAERSGLNGAYYSTQAAFLDYDLDGDLDMYLVNNALESYNRNAPIGQRSNGTGRSQDKFYRNDGVAQDNLPHFTDVSFQAGIQDEGWGLGVVINDINADGYPDVYISNDFLSTDHLYINNRNGTFSNEIGNRMKHQEYNGMGIDMADINNDGLNDLVCVDMMPDDNLRQKTMFSGIGYDRFNRTRQMGYQPQYVRNVLQLNNGNGSFSEIGFLAGVNATDWSWSSLFADFDNDGFRDLLITNGYRKDITDLDFTAYNPESSMFGTDSIRLQKMSKIIEKLNGVKKPNFLFKNNHDLTFTNMSDDWGLAQPSYTNGAAYADLDNDGDLDLVMNNINDKAFVYRNNLESNKNSAHHFLQIKLKGDKGNFEGLGTKISIHSDGKKIYAEHQLQRGYKSTMDGIEHFGLGDIQKLDSIRIDWQSGKTQLLLNINADQVITIEEKNGETKAKVRVEKKLMFTESHDKYELLYMQIEEDFVDYKQWQATLPQKHSQSGPGMAVGDINGDGLEDLVIGGAARKSATIFLQTTKGVFKKDSLELKDNEDMGLLLFDADNDNDLDLYCVSGSSEYKTNTKFYQDRLYKNNGKGKFTIDTSSLPKIESSGSCVTAADFDKDGDLDLFVGGRVLPTRYPEAPVSYLLQNNGRGQFTENTTVWCPSLQRVGMVTSSLWSDFDNDGWIDLIVAGEWMPITFYKNEVGKKLVPVSALEIGWWNSLTGGDFDNDGDIDYIAGNLGLNSLLKASANEPVSIYAKDFDSNGSMDPIITRYIDHKEVPTSYRETMTDQIVGLRRKLTSYALYGKMTFNDIFPEKDIENAIVYSATCFASSYIENLGQGKFALKPLPTALQVSPIFGLLTMDIDGDGNLDVLAIGNSYSCETHAGYYDAGIGSYLRGDGKGNFDAVPVVESGFYVDKDAKSLVQLNFDSKRLFFAAANQDSLKVYEEAIQPIGNTIKTKPNDVSAELNFFSGKKRKQELYWGEGYLSQNSRAMVVPRGIKEIVIKNGNGQTRKITFTE